MGQTRGCIGHGSARGSKEKEDVTGQNFQTGFTKFDKPRILRNSAYNYRDKESYGAPDSIESTPGRIELNKLSTRFAWKNALKLFLPLTSIGSQKL